MYSRTLTKIYLSDSLTNTPHFVKKNLITELLVKVPTAVATLRRFNNTNNGKTKKILFFIDFLKRFLSKQSISVAVSLQMYV